MPLNKDRIKQQLSFLKEIDKLKHIDRIIYFLNKNRKENDAEHTWHMAMFLLTLSKDLPKEADLLKMLKMILIHDLPEIYAGDTFAFDKTARINKQEREKEAANKLFSQLPDDLKQELIDLFEEFEGKKSIEAKIVSSIDKFQAFMQNIHSGWEVNKKHNIPFEETYKYNNDIIKDIPFLKEVLDFVVEEEKENINKLKK